MSRRRSRAPRSASGGTSQRGFSLIELLMTVVVAGIFAGGLYAFVFSSTDAARSSGTIARAQAGGRGALARFTRDVRQAISQDAGVTPPVSGVSATELVLYVDPRREPGQLEPRPQRIRYRIDGTDLVREASAPVGATAPFGYGPFAGREVLVENVANGSVPAFGATSRFGGVVSLPASGPSTRFVELVSIHLVIDIRSGNAWTTTEVMTDATLRNAAGV